MLTRRSFLQLLPTALVGLHFSSAKTPKETNLGKAKNLIFFISDGLSPSALSLCSHFQRDILKKTSNWEFLGNLKNFHRSFQNTRSHSSLVTDSAAASSAWGCGERIPNGKVNINKNGIRLETLAQKAKIAGKSVGMVTTCEITHATPAGFASHAESRNDFKEIALEYLEHQIDFLAGGGSHLFGSSDEKNSLYSKFKEQNYQICLNPQEFQKITPESPVLALFSESHFPYAIDRISDSKIPKLPELAKSALNYLSQNKKGFFLQIEAGRVDQGAHVNDPYAMVYDQIEADSTFPILLEFIKKNPDTLLIITADHGTGGVHLKGCGNNYNDSLKMLTQLTKGNCSFEKFFNLFFQDKTPENAIDLLEQNFHLQIPDHEVRELCKKLAKLNYQKDPCLVEISKLISPKLAIAWTTTGHTGDLVDLLTTGPGSEGIPNYIDNFKLHEIICEACL